MLKDRIFSNSNNPNSPVSRSNFKLSENSGQQFENNSENWILKFFKSLDEKVESNVRKYFLKLFSVRNAARERVNILRERIRNRGTYKYRK